MDPASYINLVGYIACSVIGALCNIVFLFALSISPSMRQTFGTSTILLAALAIVDLLTATIGAPSRVWNMLSASVYGVRQQYWFTPGSFICTSTLRTFYTLTHSSQWILLSIAFSRTCAVYAPFFYKRYVRLPTVQITLAVISCAISASTSVLGWVFDWYVVVPIDFDAGMCQPIPTSNSTEAMAKYELYLNVETWLSMLPLPLGVGLYFITFSRLWWRLRRRRRRQQVTAAHNRHPNMTTIKNPRVIQSISNLVRSAVVTNHVPAMPPNKLSHLEQTMHKVRLLLINHLANVLLVLPAQAAFGFGIVFLDWSFKVPALWAVVNVMYISSVVVNALVFVVVSKDVRNEYKRICGF